MSVWGRLPVLALAAALLAGPAFAADGPHMQLGACPDKEAELMKVVRAYTDCVTPKVDAMAEGDQTPDAIAQAAMGACVALKAPVVAFYRACKLDPADIDRLVHDNAVVSVDETRHPSRADRSWIGMITAETGDCRMGAADFAPAVSAHLDCLTENFGQDGDYASGFGGLADKSLAACRAKEQPIQSHVARCVPGKAEAMMASYRAYAREWTVSSALAAAMEQNPENIPDPRARTEEIRNALVSFEGCFIIETRLRVLAGAGKRAATSRATEACAEEGREMARIVQDRLGKDAEAAFRHYAVMQALMFAGQGLPADAQP